MLKVKDPVLSFYKDGQLEYHCDIMGVDYDIVLGLLPERARRLFKIGA